MSYQPTLSRLLERVILTALSRMFVARPARVEAYDAENQTVDVTPTLKEVVEGEETTRVQEMPRVNKVPLCWPRAGNWFLSAPLAPGDYVLLVCADRSIDTWQERGGIVDPIDLRRHNITDAIAIPGVYPRPDALTESGIGDDMILGHQGGAVCRFASDGTIELGATSSTKQPVGLADDILTQLQAIQADLTALLAWAGTHTHPVTGTGTFSAPGDVTIDGASSSPAVPPVLSYVASEVGSSKVSVEI